MTTLYGIPNCDTMKKAMRWLDARGIDYRFHDYRKDGLDQKQLKAWEKEPQRYWINAPQEVADLLVNWMGPFHEGREWLQRDEAQRSIGMAMQTMMLVAQEMGYQSCPMIGFDIDEVAKLINLPDDHAISRYRGLLQRGLHLSTLVWLDLTQ